MVSFTPREADALCTWGMVVVMQSVSTGISCWHIDSLGNWFES